MEKLVLEDDRSSNLINCPVCDSESKLIYAMKSNQVCSELHDYFGEPIPDQIRILDYEIYRCVCCTLEFAIPLKAGSDDFYKWITTRSGYYTQRRWEWSMVVDHIKNRALENFVSVLDVGCGGGSFLELLHNLPNVRAVGLDTTSSSVEHCKQKGLEAYCETLESFQKRFPTDKFDYVLSFHCLEHVSDPKLFVSSMLPLLTADGRLFISTPYSPMFPEHGWFNILNHPPHHLTRWNQKSYDEFARQIGCTIKYYMPSATSLLGRTKFTLRLAKVGRLDTSSKIDLRWAAISQPLNFLNLLWKQLNHPRFNGKVAADVVLVELQQKAS